MTQEINEGVRLLVERMKTHPEEVDKYRWSDLINEVSRTDLFTEEELALVRAAYRDAYRQKFTSRVLDTLMNNDPGEDTLRIKAEGRYVYAGGGSGGAFTTSNKLEEMVKTKLASMKSELMASPFGAVPKAKE